jgi:predicted permease
MADNNLKDLNKKARNAMFLVAVLNLVTALMFWIAYDNSGETGFMIAVIVNIISAIIIVVLTQTLMKKGRGK